MRRAFTRSAREAIQHALFYIGLGYDTANLGAAASLLPFLRKWRHSTNEDLRRASHEMAERVRVVVESVAWDRAIDGDDVVRSWKTLRRALTANVSFPLGRDSRLPAACHAFLRETRPEKPLLNETLPNALRWLRKVFASVVTMSLAVYVSFSLEQVGALFVNAGWVVAIPIAVLMLPILLTWIFADRKRRDGQVYFWDLGGVPFRSYAFQALPPGRGFPLYAETSPLPARLFKRIFANISLYVFTLSVVVVGALLHWEWTGSSHLYTAVLTLGIFYLAICAAFLLDFWDFYSQLRIRLAFIGVGALLFLTINLENGVVILPVVLLLLLGKQLYHLKTGSTAARTYHLSFAVFFGLLASIALYSAFKQSAKDWVEGDREVTRVSAQQWPSQAGADGAGPVVVLVASGGGSRAAAYTAMTLEALHAHSAEIACSLQAISSVSGGSLANAAYVAARLKNPDCEALSSNEPNWLLDRVTGDYILATLLGLVNGKGRGQQIEDTWRVESGLGSTRLSELVTRWSEPRPADSAYPPFAVPLFNTTTLDTHDVVVSPLSRSVYGTNGLTKSAQETNRYSTIAQRFDGLTKDQLESTPTWVYYRGGVYGLEDLLPSYDPDLAESVRASANFPFGFPLVRVKTTKPMFFSPLASAREEGELRNVFLSDGGVLSNSGMWSMYRLLMNQAAVLRERGVLLIIVEASKMPSYPRVRQITGLLSAIENKEPLGRSMHRRMLEALSLAYGSRFEAVQIDLVPTAAMNVMTTWTLSLSALSTLEQSFAVRWACAGSTSGCTKVETQIDEAWGRLKAPFTEVEDIEDIRPRPPLS